MFGQLARLRVWSFSFQKFVNFRRASPVAKATLVCLRAHDWIANQKEITDKKKYLQK